LQHPRNTEKIAERNSIRKENKEATRRRRDSSYKRRQTGPDGTSKKSGKKKKVGKTNFTLKEYTTCQWHKWWDLSGWGKGKKRLRPKRLGLKGSGINFDPPPWRNRQVRSKRFLGTEIQRRNKLHHIHSSSTRCAHEKQKSRIRECHGKGKGVGNYVSFGEQGGGKQKRKKKKKVKHCGRGALGKQKGRLLVK